MKSDYYGKKIFCVLLQLFVYWFMLSLLTAEDVCDDPNKLNDNVVINQSIPSVDPQFVVFYKELHSLNECVSGCCMENKCDVVFMIANKCYFVQCYVSGNYSCAPIETNALSDLVMVDVKKRSGTCPLENTVYEGGDIQTIKLNHASNMTKWKKCNTLCALYNDNGSEGKQCTHWTYSKLNCTLKSLNYNEIKTHVLNGSFSGSVHCSEYNLLSEPNMGDLVEKLSNLTFIDYCKDNESSCPINEECKSVFNDSSNAGYSCVCEDTFSRDPSTKICTSVNLINSASRPQGLSCEMSLGQCLNNEVCKTVNEYARGGSCHCVEGYVRNKTSMWCENTNEFTVTNKSKKVEIVNETKIHNVSHVKDNSTKISDIQNDTVKISTNVNKVNVSIAPTIKTPTKSNEETVSISPISFTTPSPDSSGNKLVVSAGEDKDITLPVNEVTLSAFVLGADTSDKKFSYIWTLIKHPKGDDYGLMVDKNTKNLKLSELIEGLYTFKVSVSSKDEINGEAQINVTVHPLVRVNSPPIAVIKPANQSVNEPNDVVIDGSDSIDDDKVVSYNWELVSGPLSSGKLADDVDVTQSTLVLKKLAPGNYKFKLTVKDSDAAENFTFAKVAVIKEIDYPPKANPGSNVIINLPVNSVTLNGNASTDDKGIVSYEWIKKSDDKLTADMTGVRSSLLQLSNLEVGDYTFTLKVTDESDQSSASDVHVFVKPESNKLPVAVAGKNSIIWLPQSSTTLDGSNSTDDKKLKSYNWEQVSGPSKTVIENSDRAVATIANLIVGIFKFKLTVIDDEDKSSSDVVTITVKKDVNEPPVAYAGGDKIIILPNFLVKLDGSKSSDDKQTLIYYWVRESKSIAAGNIANGSENEAVLLLTNLVPGRYLFKLTVTDSDGLTASDIASLIVQDNPNKKHLIEMVILADISHFSESSKNHFEDQISFLLHLPQETRNTVTVIENMIQDGNHLKMQLYAYNENPNGEKEIIAGVRVLSILKHKFRNNRDVTQFPIIHFDTLVCQNNCSGHGRCDFASKVCICEAFWMENIFRSIFEGESNCDWSILYVTVIVFVIFIVSAGIVWSLIFRRCYQWKVKKRHRYSLLDEKTSKGRSNGHNVNILSETDLSSDEEETIFIKKNSNPYVKNGNASKKA